MFLCFLLVPAAQAVTLDIPRIEGVIEGPKGYVFDDHHLRLHWHCIEDSYMPMNSTGSKECGGIGEKSGTQIVNVGTDGSFEISPVKVERLSFVRRPHFVLQFGLFHNRDKSKTVDSSGYAKIYTNVKTDSTGDRLRKDLSQLKIIRVVGGRFPLKISSKEGDGEKKHFNLLMDTYPLSYNYSSRVIIWVYGSKEAKPKVASYKVINGKIEISDVYVLQVGEDDQVYMYSQIEARIGLVKKVRGYKLYSKVVRLGQSFLKLNENFEASFSPEYFEAADIVIPIE